MIGESRVLAIIPARGGSKGIPGKNLKVMGSWSLLEWIIRAAKAATLVDRIVVSSDCPQIGAEAERCGVQWIRRPDDISGDEAKHTDALRHAIEHCIGFAHIAVNLAPTQPFTAAADIDGTIRALVGSHSTWAASVVRHHAPVWLAQDKMQGRCVTHFEFGTRQASKLYRSCGDIRVFWVDHFLKFGQDPTRPAALYEMPAERDVDIDSPRDLEIARLLLENGLL